MPQENYANDEEVEPEQMVYCTVQYSNKGAVGRCPFSTCTVEYKQRETVIQGAIKL